MDELLQKKGNNMSKVLVAFFSRGDENYGVGTVEVGNTEILAKIIAEKIGADTFKIEPVVPYPVAYADCVEKATEEADEEERPEFKGEVENIDQYDTVFLGYPIWWGDLPMICYSFLEKYDLTGKKLIPFNTHEGSGNSGTYTKLKEAVGGAEILGGGFNMTGIAARGDGAEAEIESWLKDLGYLE